MALVITHRKIYNGRQQTTKAPFAQRVWGHLVTKQVSGGQMEALACLQHAGHGAGRQQRGALQHRQPRHGRGAGGNGAHRDDLRQYRGCWRGQGIGGMSVRGAMGDRAACSMCARLVPWRQAQPVLVELDHKAVQRGAGGDVLKRQLR